MCENCVFLAPNKESYNMFYQHSPNKIVTKQLRNIPDTQSYDSYEEYSKECDNWQQEILNEFPECFLPYPISFSYKYPIPPYIPSAQEKIKGSYAERLAAKSFNVKTSRLYPQNELKLQDLILNYSLLEGIFPETGPRGEKIPINAHIQDGKFFSTTLIPPKPIPHFFQSYEDYKNAMNNWIRVSQTFAKDIPNPRQLGEMINIHSFLDECESDRMTLENVAISNSPIDMRLSQATFNPKNIELIKSRIIDLRNSAANLIVNGNIHYQRPLALPVDTTISLNDMKQQLLYQFFFSLRRFTPTVIPSNKLYSCLQYALKFNSAKEFRFSLLKLAEILMNSQNFNVKSFFEGDLQQIYSLAYIMTEFSNENLPLFEPLPLLEADELKEINEAYINLLKYNYCKICVDYFDKRNEVFTVAFQHYLSYFGELTSIESDYIKNNGSKFLEILKSNLNESNMDLFMAAYLLIFSIGSPTIDKFIVDQNFTFISFVMALNELNPVKCKSFLIKVFMTKSCTMAIISNIIAVFSQVLTDKLPENELMIQFIFMIFSLNDAAFSQDIFKVIHLMICKVAILVNRQSNYIMFDLMQHLCNFAFRKLENINDSAIVTPILQDIYAAVVSIIPFADNPVKAEYLLDFFWDFANNPFSSSILSNIDFTILQFVFVFLKSNNIPCSLAAWKVTSYLISMNKQFRAHVLSNEELTTILSDAAYHPIDPCIFYVVKMIMNTLNEENAFSEQHLNKAVAVNTQTSIPYQEFKKIIIAPEVKLEGLIKSLLCHKNLSDIPQQFYVLSTFESFIEKRTKRQRNLSTM